MWLLNQSGDEAYNDMFLKRIYVDETDLLAEDREGKIKIIAKYDSEETAKSVLNRLVR